MDELLYSIPDIFSIETLLWVVLPLAGVYTVAIVLFNGIVWLMGLGDD